MKDAKASYMLTDRIIQMMTKQGFVELFWKDFFNLQHKNRKITHQEVYERLEKEYLAATGQRRYANFKSFRVRRDER